MSDVHKIVYRHNGGPVTAFLEIERLPSRTQFFRAEVRFTDATDFERALLLLIETFTPQVPRPRRW